MESYLRYELGYKDTSLVSGTRRAPRVMWVPCGSAPRGVTKACMGRMTGGRTDEYADRPGDAGDIQRLSFVRKGIW